MRISDWSSDVCSSDLTRIEVAGIARVSVDPLDEGRSDIGHLPARNSRLAVDDPVALKLSRNRQVIARKVIPLGDRVIVPRIAADLENALHSSVLAKINLHQVAWRMSGRPGSTSQSLNADFEGLGALLDQFWRSEDHTSELQSLMRLTYA